jgi:protein-tyrosine-phosphatase
VQVAPADDLRSARHAALGDPIRLAIVDELVGSDRSPFELGQLTGAGSNLLAHHLDVLEAVGLVTRSRSSGDGRRRYVHLHRDALAALVPGRRIPRQPVLFVCTHNSARSQLASALWARLTAQPAESAGTHPARRVHPGAVAAGRRAGLDLTGARPRHLDDTTIGDRLVVTVCDRAHEELHPAPSWLHWSVVDPVAAPSTAAFDTTVADLRERITSLVDVIVDIDSDRQ